LDGEDGEERVQGSEIIFYNGIIKHGNGCRLSIYYCIQKDCQKRSSEKRVVGRALSEIIETTEVSYKIYVHAFTPTVDQ
jgi:hypothetical protein